MSRSSPLPKDRLVLRTTTLLAHCPYMFETHVVCMSAYLGKFVRSVPFYRPSIDCFIALFMNHHRQLGSLLVS